MTWLVLQERRLLEILDNATVAQLRVSGTTFSIIILGKLCLLYTNLAGMPVPKFTVLLYVRTYPRKQGQSSRQASILQHRSTTMHTSTHCSHAPPALCQSRANSTKAGMHESCRFLVCCISGSDWRQERQMVDWVLHHLGCCICSPLDRVLSARLD